MYFIITAALCILIYGWMNGYYKLRWLQASSGVNKLMTVGWLIDSI